MSTVTADRSRLEAMADVPGVCQLPLTRAVVEYREVHELDPGGGSIEDLGVGVVLDGEYAASAEIVDLGSGKVKQLDLGTELVILDWVYEPSLDHLRRLLEMPDKSRLASGHSIPGPLIQFCHGLVHSLLDRLGFGPLTRPVVLRIGFRDICRDLDLHDTTAVRVVVAPGRITRFRLDYHGSTLLVRTNFPAPDADFERALQDLFPDWEVRRLRDHHGDPVRYRVRLPLPLSLGECRGLVRTLRKGLLELFATYEPDRFEAIDRALDTFGARDTLARLHMREPSDEALPLTREHWPSRPAVH